MKNLYEKFRGLPLTVRIAIVFLTTIATIATLTIPQIAIPFLIIVGIIGSLMRIFIYFTEDK